MPINVTQKATPQGKSYNETDKGVFWCYIDYGDRVDVKKMNGKVMTPHPIIVNESPRLFINEILQQGREWTWFRNLKYWEARTLIDDLQKEIPGPNANQSSFFIQKLNENFPPNFTQNDPEEVEQYLQGLIPYSALQGYQHRPDNAKYKNLP